MRKITQDKLKRRNSNIPVIALVGYTNVGKSAFMNYLMKKEEVKSKDLLFQTLNTTSRQYSHIHLDSCCLQAPKLSFSIRLASSPTYLWKWWRPSRALSKKSTTPTWFFISGISLTLSTIFKSTRFSRSSNNFNFSLLFTTSACCKYGIRWISPLMHNLMTARRE